MRITLLSFSFFLIFLFAFEGFGQGLCDRGGGDFELSTYEGCVPLTVTITNKVPNPIVLGYNGNYDGVSQNPSFVEVTSVTYNNPGSFIFLQQAAISTGRVYACRRVKAIETGLIQATYSSCGGGQVSLQLTENAILNAYDQVEIKWGDGETEVWKKGSSLTLRHNYANVSQQPTITFQGMYTSGVCKSGRVSSIPITFERPQLNEIQVSAVEMRNNGTLRVTYKGVAGIPTNIQYSSDGTTFVTSGKRTTGGTQPYEIQSLNMGQVYKVRLSSEDLCAGSTETQPITSMTLSGTTADGVNTLKWNQYPDAAQFDGYDLLRDGTVIQSFTGIGETTYNDEDVECGTFVEYQVVAKLKSATSASAAVGLKVETGSAKPLAGGSVSVLDASSVVIKADVPGAGGNSTFELSIERAEAGSTLFKKIITLYNQSEYIDNAAKTSEMSYCYRMSYENSCGQKVPVSQPVCTILLNKNLSTLNWTPESPILGGMDGYTVVQTGSAGSSQEIDVQQSTSYTIKLDAQSDLEYNFQVKTASPDGEFESLSNIINYRRNAGVFVPDAFTPNGDGFNDILEAKSEQLQSFDMSVMNRWGVVVFHSDDITKGWDGTVDGTNAPVGYYYYKMTFTDDINQTVEKSGTFMLLR